MFSGSFEVKMDEKYRISLPVEFKEELSSGKYYIMKNFDSNSLQIINETEYKKYFSFFNGPKFSSGFNAEKNNIKRIFMSGELLDLDKSLRIMIKSGLRTPAKLSERCKVMIIGMGDRIEIWECEAFCNQTSPENIAPVLKELDDLFLTNFEGDK